MCSESVDQRLWGKSDGLDGHTRYPLVCHLLDTGAIAGALWDRVLTDRARDRLAALVGVPVEVCRRLVCTWAGLHDLGKATPSFQALVTDAHRELAGDSVYRGGFDAMQGKLRHDVAAQWVLPEVFDLWGYPKEERRIAASAQHQIAQLLAGHHGCFYRPLEQKHALNPLGWAPGLGGEGWSSQRLAHAAAVRRLMGRDSDELLGPVPAAAAVPLLGLIVVADWLASQEHVIKERLPGAGWRAGDDGLSEHWQTAVSSAEAIVAEVGLGACSFRDVPFSEQFPFQPNDLQASLAGSLQELVDGPGLLVVTAPTGDGKTEAGLHAASVMARAAGSSGVYFALPTMATADAMYLRVRDFVEGNAEGERFLTLLHSMAWLSKDYAVSAVTTTGVQGGSVLSENGTRVAAGQWLRGAKRGLLAPVSVGTIDQALTGVLPVRYNILRLLGLSNKVLVVDEAHAYGPWMQSLLVRLLEWLGAMGAPVVLLSATLAGRTASVLVEAYRRGCGYMKPSPVEPVYPGWFFVSATTGKVTPPLRVGSDRSRRLRLEPIPVIWDGDDAGSGTEPGTVRRLTALAQALAPVVSEGGCVLVCCTTVAEAQQTYRFLRERFPELAASDDGLLLLHSRYPAARRAQITQVCEEAFGKPGEAEARGESARPRASVLVATQVVEQSLDLDFDLVISDLAPLAQLLQRAGRCMRHDRSKLAFGAGGRPEWVGDDPRVVVLEPATVDGEVRAPASWGTVYFEDLLVRTSELLRSDAQGGVDVPGDVQRLVDRVYATDLADCMGDAAQRERLRILEAERQGTEMAEETLAQLTAIASPIKLFDLSRLSNEGGQLVDEALVTTRLGADSARVVCAFEQPDGTVSLDPEGTVPLPQNGSLTGAEVRAVMLQSAPLPGRWLAGRTDAHEVPASWRKWPVLAGLTVLPMRPGPGPDGQPQWTCRVGDRTIIFSDQGFASS
ncbi:CRISPR-associated helicase Cas3' [Streptomyces sp. C36]|uniref:CRISPR-associated helicase Cas3' n=1 Tax=Streptomyces sp. C36 TaxID=3237122 RepID=UPI0034C699D8